MTSALLFLGAIMAIVVWWLVRQTLNVTPWMEQRAIEVARGNGALSLPPVKVGLGVFLAVATSLFALLISAYHMRMMESDWTTLALPRVLWLNTGVLILASVAMQWTRVAARRRQMDGVRNGLIAGGAFTFAFLAGQLWAWQQLNATGHFTAANPAYAFFFLLTALHGMHLLGGLWVWARTTARAWRGADVEQGAPERGAVHRVLALSARGLGGLVRRAAAYTPLEEIHAHDATRADEYGRGSPAGPGPARHRRRLVLGPAGVQERPLGQGDDVDLPAQRHVHLQLVPDLVHDGADVHDGPVAQPERGLRADDRRARASRSS